MVESLVLQDAILEKYEGLSQGSDVKNAQGGTNYYVDVLYNQSEYIYWMDVHESTLANAGFSSWSNI